MSEAPKINYDMLAPAPDAQKARSKVKRKPLADLDEASHLMRGLFSNLMYEAKSLDDYMQNLSSCASCSHVFDLRDKRHAIVDGHHFCPACTIEAEARATTT